MKKENEKLHWKKTPDFNVKLFRLIYNQAKVLKWQLFTSCLPHRIMDADTYELLIFCDLLFFPSFVRFFILYLSHVYALICLHVASFLPSLYIVWFNMFNSNLQCLYNVFCWLFSSIIHTNINICWDVLQKIVHKAKLNGKQY